MKIKDLKQPYQALAEMRREQQKDSEWVKRNQKYFEEDGDLNYAFEWLKTPEGHDWWADTSDSKYPTIHSASLSELKEWQKEYEVSVIAEQPKEKTLFVRLLQSQSHVWHYSKVGQIFEVAPFDKDCYLVVGVNPKEHGFDEPLFIAHSDCKVLGSKQTEPDPRLFQAAVAAMQGMLASGRALKNEPFSKAAWDYAQDLIAEGKKRGKLD